MTRHSSTPGLTAALATIAILLTACTDDASTPASADDEPATSTPTASSPTQPAPSPTDWTPLEDDGTDEILPPGRYGLNARADTPWAVAEVPAGFSNFGGWALLKEDPGGGGVAYMTVSKVYRDPCRSGDFVDVGTVEDAAAAFQKQQRTRVTAPTPVTIDGYQGLYLELHVPKDVDFADCGRNYYFWYSEPIGDRYVEGPGFERVWILDVEGDVVVLDAPDGSDVPQSTRDRITEMIESVDFIARD